MSPRSLEPKPKHVSLGPWLQPWKTWQRLIVCQGNKTWAEEEAHPRQWGPSAAPQRHTLSPCFLALPQHLPCNAECLEHSLTQRQVAACVEVSAGQIWRPVPGPLQEVLCQDASSWMACSWTQQHTNEQSQVFPMCSYEHHRGVA